MLTIDQQTEDFNRNLPASTQNNAAFNESVLDENFPVSSSEGEKDVTLMLSRELALFINPKQADLTASFIIYGLYTWQVSKRRAFGYNPTINGKPCCYRSLRELEAEYPWLGHNSILKALRRAENVLEGELIVRVVKRNGQSYLHFLLSDQLIQTYKFNCSERCTKSDRDGNILARYWKRQKSGLISFQKNDAIKHGMTGAILIANLKYIVDAEHNSQPLEDEAGNIYRQLSPTALTKPMPDKNGVMKAPLPVSSDTITRELNTLKGAGVFFEHPLQNNFYTLVSTMKPLKVNAAEVTTPAAEVTTLHGILACNTHECSVLEQNSQTLDSNEDVNGDGKCVMTASASLRSTAAVASDEASFLVRKQMLLSSAQEAISLLRQKEKTSVPLYDIRRYAVYDVQDYDQVRLAGYELDHEIVTFDWNTGKPYARELELDNYMTECKMMFASLGMLYTKADKQKLHDLFSTLLWLTPKMIHDHITHGYLHDLPPAPKKGHDFHYFIRRIKTVKHFLRYFPQLMREKYLNRTNFEWIYHPVTRKPIFDYSEMDEPFFSWLFSDNKVPVDWCEVTVMEAKPEVGYYLRNGLNIQFLTGETILVETTRLKLFYYDEVESKDYEPLAYEFSEPGDWRYEEMLALPVLKEQWQEPRYINSVEIRQWEKKHGHPEAIQIN